MHIRGGDVYRCQAFKAQVGMLSAFYSPRAKEVNAAFGEVALNLFLRDPRLTDEQDNVGSLHWFSRISCAM